MDKIISEVANAYKYTFYAMHDECDKMEDNCLFLKNATLID